MRGSSAGDPEQARPLSDLRLEPMVKRHLAQVLAIERASFAGPWRSEHFEFEIRRNRFAVNRVATSGDRVVGYSSCWEIDDELRIHKIAVGDGSRRRGVARWMLRRILAEAGTRGCHLARLEVRESNVAARRLYVGMGFVEVDRRRDYYVREGEDALVYERRIEPGP